MGRWSFPFSLLPLNFWAMKYPTGNFDVIAPLYDFLAKLVLGKGVRLSQVCLLDQLKSDADLLIIGGGRGWILPEIFDRCPPRSLVYLDLSTAMIEAAQHVAESLPTHQRKRITWIQGDEGLLPDDLTYDGIMAFFFFDLFTQPNLESLFKRLNSHLRPGGQLLLADFFPKKDNWTHQFTLTSMYLFFKWIAGLQTQQMPDIKGILEEYRYQYLEGASFNRGFIEAQLWQKPLPSSV